MVEAQRALLDELMGAARNLTAEERKGYREVRWDDREVCGFYLVRFCPHDLFVNTKSDLGPCRRIHDQKLKESFEKSPRHDIYVPRFEAELNHFCEKLIQDLDRKGKRGRERLAQDVDVASLVPVPSEKAEQLGALEEKIKKLLEQCESLGEDGKVDEAQAIMKKVDVLNIEKSALMQLVSNERGLAVSQEKKMALCDICGSFLVANDAAERTQSHVTGKQHVGYGLVRDYLSEYKAKRDNAMEEERQVKEKEMDERAEKEKEYERAKENGRYRERDNDDVDEDGPSRPERRREHRMRDRDRDRDRSRGWDRGRRKEGRMWEWNHDTERDHGRRRDHDSSHVSSGSPLGPRSRSPGRHYSRLRSRSPND